MLPLQNYNVLNIARMRLVSSFFFFKCKYKLIAEINREMITSAIAPRKREQNNVYHPIATKFCTFSIQISCHINYFQNTKTKLNCTIDFHNHKSTNSYT